MLLLRAFVPMSILRRILALLRSGPTFVLLTSFSSRSSKGASACRCISYPFSLSSLTVWLNCSCCSRGW
uniref:Putative secreted protein n=1 Tax=Anopheles darlingi TaxID=43151 RepID=A0A2M4D261_ANODA